jgi:hypothetical protein
MLAGSDRTRARVTPAAAIPIAAAVGAAAVLVVQVAHLGDRLDPDQTLTAGHSAGLLAAYVIGVAALAVATLALSPRLLWVPPAVAGAVAGLLLLATLTIGREGWSFAFALLTMGACWAVGARALAAIRLPALAACPPAAWLAGVGILGVAVTLVGRAGWLRWWTVAVPVGVLGLTALPAVARAAAGVLRRQPTRLEAASAALAAGVLGVAAIYAAAPDVTFDALAMKAYLPTHWAHTGSIVPSKVHGQLMVSGFAQVLAVPGHLAGAPGVGRYMQWLSFAGLIASVWWIARRSGWAPLAAAAVAVTPHLFWQATTAYDDAVLALGAVALAAAVVVLLRPRMDAPPLAAGIALGVLAATCVNLKLHMAPLAGVLALGCVAAAWSGRARLRALAGAAVGGLAALAAPFAIRWIDLDNPVLPAYNNVFRSDLWPPINEQFAYPYTDDGPLEFVAHLVAAPERFSEGMSPPGALGLLVAALVVAIGLLWIAGRRDRGVLVLWAAVLVGAVVSYVQFRSLRFLLPTACVAVTALAVAAPRAGLTSRAQRFAVVAACLSAALFWPSTIAQFWYVPDRRPPWRAALGRESDIDYEHRFAFDHYVAEAFDRIAPRGAGALTGMHQRLWLDPDGGRDFFAPFEVGNRLLSPAGRTRGSLLRRLHAIGIGWAIAQPDQPLDWPVGRRAVARYGEIAYADNTWAIYRLVADPQRPRRVHADAGGTVPVCPGQTLVAEIRAPAGGPPVQVAIDYQAPDPRQGHVRAAVEPGSSRAVAATAPEGSAGATVAADPPPERVRLGVLGECP